MHTGTQAHMHTCPYGHMHTCTGRQAARASIRLRGCPLSKFNNNSAIIRAVSAHPEGPYQKAETVFPPFHHNPTVTITPNGTYLLFFIGEIEHREANCTRAEKEWSTAPALKWKPQTDVISMAWSDSISGPWRSRVVLPAASPTARDVLEQTRVGDRLGRGGERLDRLL